MAGKGGGGAWKVAYADFVTAMMAFFMVMWLTAQNQQIKSAVADYFGDPLSNKRGSSKVPFRTGAIMNTLNTGPVPATETVSLGRGRETHTVLGITGPATKVVSDWLHHDVRTMAYWREQGQQIREKLGKEKGKGESGEEVVAEKLGKQLREDVTRSIPEQATGVYKDLLKEILAEVNWTELAEDILSDG